jgi:elongation of very long chain fatty acids protein 4
MGLSETYQWALAQGDKRVANWPVMNPVHTIGIIVLYLAVIFGLKKVMEKREAMKLSTFAMIHNVHLCLLSLYMCVGIIREAVRRNYSLFGNSLDTSETGQEMARMIWIFYVSKIVEFGDTIIMALKKNNRQISFLHVYHHTSIFFIWWVICYYAPGGESYFSAALNSFIHVLMYGYYFWSTVGAKPAEGQKPRPHHPVYWKEWITRSQMIQFCIMMIQATCDLWITVPKSYPRFCVWILFYYMMTMLALFGQFYIQSYLKGAKGKEKSTVSSATANGTSTAAIDPKKKKQN